jgi:hypothetical protein
MKIRSQAYAVAAGICLMLAGAASHAAAAPTCNGMTATVVGTPNNDTLSGGGGKVIDAGSGDDLINELTSGDAACGDDGYDTFQLAANATGTITVDGGTGADVLDFSQLTTPVSANLETGAISGTGWTVSPVSGSSSTNVSDLTGGAANDTLIGDDAENSIFGGPGDDTIDGGAGNDNIDARDQGPDTVDCGPGLDIVYADAQDSLSNCEDVRLAPQCTSQTLNVTENATLPVALKCTGYAGATLTYHIQAPPVHGSITGPDAAGNLSYTPTSGFVGVDQVTFVADDGSGYGNNATLSINVKAPPPPPKVSFGKTTVRSTTLLLPTTCNGVAGTTCQGSAVVTAKVQGRPRTVALAAFTLSAGKSSRVRLTLDGAAKKQLARSPGYRLNATLRVTVTGYPTESFAVGARFYYPYVSTDLGWYNVFATGKDRTSRFTKLVLDGMPVGSRLTVFCHGRGCPFARRVFRHPRRHVSLRRAFQKRKLAPGSVVSLLITAPGEVAQLWRLRTRVQAKAVQTQLCLPPGVRSPTRCRVGG